jgi:hypothetical protein
MAASESRMAADGLNNLYELNSLYWVLRFLHLAGMAGFVGMVAMLDLRGLGLFPAGALDPIRARLALVLKVCFWLTITTGVALFFRDPLEIGLHSMFLPKLLLIVLGYTHARVVQPMAAVRRRPWAKRLAAGASLAIWLLVIGASTWNHVEPPVNIATLHLADPGLR